MKIINVPSSPLLYSSNIYLLLGDWKRIGDINTLIDVGSDPNIVQALNKLDTGIGKKRVEQVILTHCHSDHTAALPAIIDAFHPTVCAFSPFVEGIDRILKNGDRLRIGERMAEIIHTPGHSSDSISIYIEEEDVLFVGDAPVIIRTATGGGYEEDYLDALMELNLRKVQDIYFGHGDPLLHDAQDALLDSLKNVRKSRHSQNVPSQSHITR